mgnify:CR=1 FL=1
MGLIKAALGAASGVMGDQWKEYFYVTLCLRRYWLSRARNGPMAALPTGTAARTSSRMAL